MLLITTSTHPEPELRHDLRVLAQLTRLEGELDALSLPLDLPGAAQARSVRADGLKQLRDYLIPRFDQWHAPLLVVVGGSTGSGKSTLVNAIAGQEVSPTSAIRPTTRLPVLLHHPDDAPWFHSSRLLPTWVRQSAATPAGTEARIRPVPVASLPAGLALIDAPDIDSLEDTNRERAAELFDVADVWLFATTAMRYADAIPWEYLHRGQARDVAIALVLGRTPPAHASEIEADLFRLLGREDLGGARVFTISEKTHPPLITKAEVDPLRQWLAELLLPERRDALVRRSALGASWELLADMATVAQAWNHQVAAHRGLVEVVQKNFGTEPIVAALADGALLRGEVLQQWHEFLGTAEYLRRLEAGVGRVRDRLRRLWRRPVETELSEELTGGFAALITATAAEACRKTYTQWSRLPAGEPLLSTDLATPAPEFEELAQEEIGAWQAALIDLVRTHGGSKRTSARIAALGVNLVALLLMIVAFASTGGLLGAEVAIAGGSAVLAQKVLEAIFGEHGMRQLAATAQADLLSRSQRLLGREADRYTSRLPELPPTNLDAVLKSAGDALARADEY